MIPSLRSLASGTPLRAVMPNLALALSLALTAPTAALASGTSVSGGAETGSAAAYNFGKTVYAKKYACSACPLAGKSLDIATAKQILAGQPKVELSEDEAGALKTYLQRRYKL